MYRNIPRFGEILEQLKNEFETLEHDLSVYKMQRDDYERKLEAQLNEFTNMQQTLHDLQHSHLHIKEKYEDEITRLKRQIDQISNGADKNPGHIFQQQQPQQSQQQQPVAEQPLSKKQRLDNPYDFPPSNPNTLGPMTVPPQGLSRPQAPPNGNNNAMSKIAPPSSPFGVNPPPPVMGPGRSNTGSVPSIVDLPLEKPKELPQGPPQILQPPQPPQLTGPMTQSVHPGMMEPHEQPNGVSPTGEKPKGTDWVVVYNPTVKTNVNINLFHNLNHMSVVCCVRFSQNGKYLATGCNRYAQIFDVESGERVSIFPEEITHPLPNASNDSKEDSYVRSVCFSPDGKYLVAGAEDRTVKVWDIKTRKAQHSLVGHELDIYSLDFSSDGRFVASGSGDGKAKIWSMDNGACLHTLGNDEVGPKEGVTSVAISPDGRLVAAGSLDCVVRLWDTHTGQFLESFEGHSDSVYSVAFSPDGKTLASGSLDRTLKLWEIGGTRNSRNRCLSTLSGHRDYVLSVAFSPDGKWLISGSKDRSVQFWDPRYSILHLMLQGHKNSVISVALNPKAQVFATGSGDHRARIWKYESSLLT